MMMMVAVMVEETKMTETSKLPKPTSPDAS
jgi:hypothetical protein